MSWNIGAMMAQSIIKRHEENKQLKEKASMKTHCEMVREFMSEVAGQECPDKPKRFDDATLRLRLRLIAEEFSELLESATLPDEEGCRDPDDAVASYVDYSEFIDALADLQYVIAGTYVAIGVDGEAVFREVHRSNMSKAGGHLNEVGKFVKPATWTPPNLKPFIEGIDEDV